MRNIFAINYSACGAHCLLLFSIFLLPCLFLALARFWGTPQLSSSFPLSTPHACSKLYRKVVCQKPQLTGVCNFSTFWCGFYSRAALCNVTGTLKHVKSSVARLGAWYRAAVVLRLWRRRLVPETRVRSPVATHILTSLNLPVSSLAPDSNWIPVTQCLQNRNNGRAHVK